jgi:hypothetical protein
VTCARADIVACAPLPLFAGFGATEANDFAISAIPSVAISGVESVFSLHGLNFVPGG